MLKIREEFKNKKIEGRKINLVINDIKESDYQHYYDNGLYYIFEIVKDKKEFKAKSINYKGTKKDNKIDDID